LLCSGRGLEVCKSSTIIRRVSVILALGSGRENAFGDQVLETLGIFAHGSAIVLDNSLLYRQLGRASQELQRTIEDLRLAEGGARPPGRD
jgi:GAF domain-containing protein